MSCSVDALCEHMYSALLKDLEVQHLRASDEQLRVQQCFDLHLKYWSAVASFVRKRSFKDKEEEIRFFRYRKPLFVSGAVFYNLLYHAVLFQPGDFIEDLRFWQRELSRSQDQVYEHQEMHDYIQQGRTDMDDAYFTRGIPVLQSTPALYCLPDEGLTSSHDRIVSLVAGLKRYEAYAVKHTAVADVLAEDEFVLN